MSSIFFLVILFIFFGFVFALVAFLAYRRALRRAKGVERGLKMIPLLIHLPPPTDDEERETHRDARQLLQEKISQAEVLYDLIAGTAQKGFKSNFYGQRHIALEIIASGGLIHYFVAVPVAMVSVVEQAILSAYPGSKLEEVEDHNIFNPQGKLTGTSGGELVLKHQAAYPISTYKHIERDPMEALLNAMSRLQAGDGAAVQIMIRPARSKWTKQGITMVAKKRKQKTGSLSFTPGDLVKASYKAPSVQHQEDQMYKPSKLEESILEQIEEKTRYPGYETLIRILASSPSFDRSEVLLRNITNAFSLFEAPGLNGFQFYPAKDVEGLVTAFIFRFFPPELTSNVLNSPELATVFHLPDAQYTPTSSLQRQTSKQVDGPVQASTGGLLMGYNIYRGTKKEIRLSDQDRRRHTYILGQTGTGKSTMLENLAVQDMLAGNGFAFIDPHGDTAEKLISMVPKERAEDVIYFNPSDMERPLGLNLFEFNDPTQKDFLINESINMLYKIYDPGKTGIIGPRFEHWFRNAALTLMADPNGASLVEIPKVFTDSAYLKNKFKYLDDPTVIDFWTKEMGQTSDYHKSEMLGWFVSKFGAFMTNDLMRNILGQTKSAFNLRDIMDNKKILIVNLSKGKLGDINAQYLGMIFVIKFQAAAMSRASIPEEQRNDFCLYVDEFQNYATDSFASILSEARKYRLNLIVANQFIGQLSDEIRDAVFGNVGTMMSYRCGPEDAEFLTKQFAPIFDVRDLVGLPNYNAVMRLMMGGLPSKPFSLSALPPLGVTHQEMGLAVKQLSAAKFGVSRPEVEAGIFARLQGKPAIVNPVPTPVAPPASTPAVNPPQPLPPAPAAAPSESAPKLSTDIASIVGQVPVPTPVAPPVSTPAVNPPQPLPPAPTPLPTPVVVPPPAASTPIAPPVPAAEPAPTSQPQATSADSAPAIAVVAPPLNTAINAPADQPALSSAPLPPVRLAGGIQVPLGSGIPSHDQIQSEINELASEAMHVSEERVGVRPESPVQTATPNAPDSSVSASPPASSVPAQPVKAVNISRPVEGQKSVVPAPKPVPDKSPAPLLMGVPAVKTTISSVAKSVPVDDKRLKIEAPHELLLSNHANSPLPHTPKPDYQPLPNQVNENTASTPPPTPSSKVQEEKTGAPVIPTAANIKPGISPLSPKQLDSSKPMAEAGNTALNKKVEGVNGSNILSPESSSVDMQGNSQRPASPPSPPNKIVQPSSQLSQDTQAPAEQPKLSSSNPAASIKTQGAVRQFHPAPRHIVGVGESAQPVPMTHHHAVVTPPPHKPAVLDLEADTLQSSQPQPQVIPADKPPIETTPLKSSNPTDPGEKIMPSTPQSASPVSNELKDTYITLVNKPADLNGQPGEIDQSVASDATEKPDENVPSGIMPTTDQPPLQPGEVRVDEDGNVIVG